MLSPMSTELDVLADVSRRLDGSGVPFMLTGSFALAFYATTRMTRHWTRYCDERHLT
jgi:hypothetical protein